MDPQFYRQHHAKRYYNEHTTLKHPEFAKWDRRIQRYYAVATTADGVLFLLFFGLTDHLPGVETLIFGLLFASSLALSAILVLIGQRQKKEFPILLEESTF